MDDTKLNEMQFFELYFISIVYRNVYFLLRNVLHGHRCCFCFGGNGGGGDGVMAHLHNQLNERVSLSLDNLIKQNEMSNRLSTNYFEAYLICSLNIHTNLDHHRDQ